MRIARSGPTMTNIHQENGLSLLEKQCAPVLPLIIASIATLGFGAGNPPHTPKSNADSVARTIVQLERDHSEAMENLEYLCDMIGPRLTGSPAARRASEWAAEQMHRMGLDNVHQERFEIPRGWERGPVRARIVEPVELPLTLVQNAWSGPTPVPVMGEVVVFTPQSDEDMAAAKGTLRGKVVLLSPPLVPVPEGVDQWSTPAAAGSVRAFRTAPSNAARLRTRFSAGMAVPDRERSAFIGRLSAFLASEGAAAVIRDAEKPYGLLGMVGRTTSPTSPRFTISNLEASRLHRLLKRGKVIVEIDAQSRITPGPISCYNTVGEIVGSEKPDEIVLIGAHLDSWDLAFGATDNGTGVAAVLEAARLMKTAGVRPMRTIRFVLFMGEEQGLLGSGDYVRRHQAELSRFSVVFIQDSGTGRVIGAALQERANVKTILEQEFERLRGFGLLEGKAVILAGKKGNSDHAPFDDAGVPAFELIQDHAEYGLTHHTQIDAVEVVRPDDLKQSACVLAILAFRAADRAEPYPRKAK
jgi:carboxypeptidase Q